VAVAKAKAEEEGESFEEDEPGPDLRLAAAPWRLRTLGVLAGGDGPELMEEQLKNALSYDGEGQGGQGGQGGGGAAGAGVLLAGPL
jgi:hypothetical protein